MTKLAWSGIVKNESARIERMLDSIGQFISYLVVVDTGSTDDTKDKIAAWAYAQHIPYEIHDAPFHDWSQARNAALAHARAAWCADPERFDYLLLVDADMQMVVRDRSVFDDLTGPSYDIYQHAGTTHYQNRRLLKADQTGQYLGVTHEFLNVDTAGCLPEDKVFFLDHADGANRPEKFKRDIWLLTRGLKDEPMNERYMFYLANSYRDAGEPEKALKWYKRRVEAGGWAEEVWQAQCNLACCRRDLGDTDGYVADTLKAYQMRPTRAEALYDLAHYYRNASQNALGALFADAAAQIPYSTDALFVNDMVYKVGCLEELSICGFYQDATREKGFAATDKLTLMKTPYGNARECARNNMYWYLKPLVDICPSFKSYPITWTPPDDGWTCLNPSVARVGNELLVVMRTVNYRMDEQGRYLIRDVYDDGTTGCNATAENPIHTRNWLLELDPVTFAVTNGAEITPPASMPCEFPLVVGFEDMRLFPIEDQLWASATVRQVAADGMPEQVLMQIDGLKAREPRIGYTRRMLRTPRLCEKNWSPWLRTGAEQPVFMYQPGHIVDAHGQDVETYTLDIAGHDLRGGSQLIPFEGGYLTLVHEARTLPNSHKRFYWHRFVWYDFTGYPQKISVPFVLDARIIEFVAGMCELGLGTLLISYGSNDAEAKLATVSHSDVVKLLWGPHEKA